MGIVHHSNYIRWMEDARIAFLKEKGLDFHAMEQRGITAPILSVSCRYMRPVRFGDEVDIAVSVEAVKGIKLCLFYRMSVREREMVCEGRTENGLVDLALQPVRLKRDYPDIYEILVGDKFAKS